MPILGLKWSNANLEEKEIRLDAGTAEGEARAIPLFGELLELLVIERERNRRPEQVFTRNGESVGSFSKAWLAARIPAEPGVMFCHTCKTVIKGNTCEARKNGDNSATISTQTASLPAVTN